MFPTTPWIIGAVTWGLASAILLGHHLRQGSPTHWVELWFLFSLLWFQFGFAGLFSDLIKRRYGRIRERILVALAPPVLLYLLISALFLNPWRPFPPPP